jgi:hypothetical protein
VLVNKAVSAARNAFVGWNGVPVGRRKAILARLLKKIDDHADELSALLATEQGGRLAQARWEIDLLTKAFGPALMQMELYEEEDDVQQIEHITEAGRNDSRTVPGVDPKDIAIFGSITIMPVNWNPGRHGLARTLFEILSFRPLRMRTQVLVWSLARKASYTFPIFR